MGNITLSKTFLTSVLLHLAVIVVLTFVFTEQAHYAVKDEFMIKFKKVKKAVTPKKIKRKIPVKQKHITKSVKQSLPKEKAVEPEPSKEDNLPTPTAEFLITKMPRVTRVIQANYPPRAKAKNIEGRVLLNILIDKKGKVKDATVIEGPGFGMNKSALKAIKKFRFEPAMVKKKKVAVRIEYAIRFVLEK